MYSVAVMSINSKSTIGYDSKIYLAINMNRPYSYEISAYHH